MHTITQNAIEAWQTSNTSKVENFTVGKIQRDMRNGAGNTVDNSKTT